MLNYKVLDDYTSMLERPFPHPVDPYLLSSWTFLTTKLALPREIAKESAPKTRILLTQMCSIAESRAGCLPLPGSKQHQSRYSKWLKEQICQ